MKVVLVSRFPADTDNPRGGVETATLALARGLVTEGIELHIVTIESGINSEQTENQEGITVHRLPRSGWPMFADVFGGPSIKRLNQRLSALQPDVVHYHETWGFSAPRCGFPAVFTVHGFDSLNLPTERPPFWRARSLVWQMAEHRGLAPQRHIISIAPYVTNQISPHTNAHIYEIWNALSISNYEQPRDREGMRVLFLGWLNPRKNPLVLVKALPALAARFPDIKLELVGEASDEDYFTKLQQEITQLGVAEHVELPGRLPQSAVRDRLQKASVLVLPSLQENAPMVIAEAMAIGVPVVATNVCGIPDMIENNTTGILLDDPYDETEVAEAISRAIGDDTLNNTMGLAAVARANDLFHPKVVAARTLDVYRAAISDFGNESH